MIRGKWENAVSGKRPDSVQKETLAVSVTERHGKTGAVTDERDNPPLLPQTRGHRLTEKPSKGSGLRGESQRRKSFWNERPKSVQKNLQRKVYESVE